MLAQGSPDISILNKLTFVHVGRPSQGRVEALGLTATLFAQGYIRPQPGPVCLLAYHLYTTLYQEDSTRPVLGGVTIITLVKRLQCFQLD